MVKKSNYRKYFFWSIFWQLTAIAFVLSLRDEWVWWMGIFVLVWELGAFVNGIAGIWLMSEEYKKYEKVRR